MAFSFGNVAIAKATRNRSVDSGVLLSVLMTGALALLGWLPERDHVPINQSVLGPMVWFGVAGILATVLGPDNIIQSYLVWRRTSCYRAKAYHTFCVRPFWMALPRRSGIKMGRTGPCAYQRQLWPPL